MHAGVFNCLAYLIRILTDSAYEFDYICQLPVSQGKRSSTVEYFSQLMMVPS